jgi:hypothetical protein
MRSNDEVGENASWADFAGPLAARRISLEGSPGGAPDPLTEIPIHPDVRAPDKLIEEGGVTAGSCHQFGEHRRGRNQWTAFQGFVECALCRPVQNGPTRISPRSHSQLSLNQWIAMIPQDSVFMFESIVPRRFSLSG